MRILYVLFTAFAVFFHWQTGYAQCTLLPNAVPGITLTYVSAGGTNASGVAYHPVNGLYYAVIAGNSGFPYETFDNVGTPLYQTTSGFDFRGLWWNPGLGQLEGNGYNTGGWWRSNLNASGYALNTGASIFTGLLQPDPQSCGDLDYNNNEVIFYFSGNIYRRNRATGAISGTTSLTGCPVGWANINWTSVVYTGCAGMEYGILDYVNKRLYLFDRATGAYSGTCQFPASAVTNNGFRFSWANGLAWLYDVGTRRWTSYTIFSTVLAAEVLEFRATLSQAQQVELEWKLQSSDPLRSIVLERSTDGIEFVRIQEQSFSGNGNYNMEDSGVPASAFVYYRLRLVGMNGEESLSQIRTVQTVSNALEQVQVFPNPSDGTCFVEFLVTGDLFPEVRVISPDGRTVYQLPAQTSENGLQRVALPLWDLPQGVYAVRIGDDQAHTFRSLVLAH